MARVMGIEYLPLEVLEVIVTHLSAADLSRCLGVSATWYNIFSNDIFWKKHCIANLSDYLSKTKCLVEPGFKTPTDPQLPIQKYRLQFLHEQHLWNNWDSGRFKKEEIKFDCDDGISYNVKVSFLDNDHVCLHTTGETEVWNVAGTPFLVMRIPYCLKEMWGANVYKVIENNLVVIQCNVVQLYKISLDTKSWCLSHVFFYDKPEEFSSSITVETDVDGLFQLEYISNESNFDRVICGEYLVGAYTYGENSSSPEETSRLYVWNIKTGKQIIEDRCEICRGDFSLELIAPRVATNKVLVTFTFENSNENDEDESLGGCCSIIYDLTQLQFLLPTRRYHNGTVLYFDGYLSVVQDSPVKIIRHYTGSTENESQFESTTCLPNTIKFVTSVQPLGSNLLISTRKEVFLIKTSDETIPIYENLCIMKVEFDLCHVDVLFNRYTLLHDVDYCSIKEIWEVGKSLRKVVGFPPDSGTYVASNPAGSKIVLEKGNKLMVLNFW